LVRFDSKSIAGFALKSPLAREILFHAAFSRPSKSNEKRSNTEDTNIEDLLNKTRPSYGESSFNKSKQKKEARIRGLWEWWKPVAHKIGNYQERFVLALFYFFILGPFALMVRWLSDPLAIKPGTRRA
jgi:hypothetical protein